MTGTTGFGRWLPMLCVLFVFWGPESVAAGGMRDLDDAWLVSAHSVSGLLSDAQARPRSWRIRIAHGRLFGMPELEQAGLGIERRWSSGTATIAWQRLGGDLYRESSSSAVLLWGPTWQIGGRLGCAALDAAGQLVDKQIEADLMVAFPLKQELVLQIWWPLTPAPIWYGEQGLRRWLLLQGRGASWAWAAVADRDAEGKPFLQGELLFRAAPDAALGLRCEPATGSVGFCTAWRVSGLVLQTSHILHPDLGTTHRWGVILGVGR
jgi:hypothetical protein